MFGVRAHDYGKREIEELPVVLRQAGFDAAQLALPRAFVGIESFDDIRLEHLRRIRSAFEQNKVTIPVFSCYLDISNPDDELRKKAVETMKKCLTYSKEVGADVVGTETSWPTLSELEKKQRYPYMIDSVKRVIEEAQRIDAKLAVEPVYRHPLDSIWAVMDLIAKVDDSKHMRIIFDPSNLLEYPDKTIQKDYWREWLSAIGKYVDTLHIKDFVPTEVKGGYQVTPLGKGVMEYEAISGWIHEEKRPICLIRDEANPKWAKADICFMKKHLCG